MPAGRPTKYSEEVVKQAVDYIEGGYKDAGDVIPSVVGLAIHLNRGKSTLYDWANDETKNFSDILAYCLDAQERTLLNGGLAGTLNSNITKLALGKHGYHDKHEHSGDKDNPLIPILNVSVSGNQSTTEPETG